MLRHLTYTLIDAARVSEQMAVAKELNKRHDSLYRGGSEASLAEVAPYIFQFAHPTLFSTWFLKKGWGDAWGVMIKSSWPLSELHKHFRKFLLVKTEDGQELYFRFYDPRVLRIFLPTCDAAQIREFFGGAIDYFMVEDEDPAYALRFSHQNGVLQTERFAVKDEIAALPEPEQLPPLDEDPLPPEAIAALKEQGIILPEGATASMLEAVLAKTIAEAQQSESAPTLDAAPVVQPTAPTATKATPSPAPSLIPAAPSAIPEPATKTKTKWNTFE